VQFVYTSNDKNFYALSSGVAGNFQGVRQSVAFLSVHSRSVALPSRPCNQKTHILSHTEKLCNFLIGGAYATCMATPLALSIVESIAPCVRNTKSSAVDGGTIQFI